MKTLNHFKKQAITIFERHPRAYIDPGYMTQKNKSPLIEKNINIAHSNTMKDYRGSSDPRVKDMVHCFNFDFGNNPIYIIGYIQNPSHPSHITISSLYIFPQYRRLGVASLLLELVLIRQARSNGSLIIQVCCDDSNTKAKKLYLQNGFVNNSYTVIDDLGTRFTDFFYCYLDLRFDKPAWPAMEKNKFTFKRITNKKPEPYTKLSERLSIIHQY